MSKLTAREKEVLLLIAAGYENKEIAEKLKISIHTAKAHSLNIINKLSTKNRHSATINALKNNLIKLEEIEIIDKAYFYEGNRLQRGMINGKDKMQTMRKLL